MNSIRKPSYKRKWMRKQLKGKGDADRDITFGQNKPDVDLKGGPSEPGLDDLRNIYDLISNKALPEYHPYVSERKLMNGQPLPPTITRTHGSSGTYTRTYYLSQEKSPDTDHRGATPQERQALDFLAQNKWLTDLVGAPNTAMNMKGDDTDYGTPPGLYFEVLTNDKQPDVQKVYQYNVLMECIGLFPNGEQKFYQAPKGDIGRKGAWVLQQCKRELAQAWGEYDKYLTEKAERERIRNLDDAERANAANIRNDKGLPNTNRYAFVRAYGMRAERARDYMDNGQWAFFNQLSQLTGNAVDLILTHMKVALDNPDAMANMEPNGTTEQGPFIPDPKVITPEMQAEMDANAAFKTKYGMSKEEARGLLERGMFSYFTNSGFDVDEVSAAL